jgi:Fe-S-cluster-containing hydrogenase component 2
MEQFCFGCNECLNACPFGAIRLDPEGMELVVCDLCQGDPECVKWCPTQAIQFVPASTLTTLRAATANKRALERGQAR